VNRQKGLRWAAVLGPGVIAGGFETVRHGYLDRWLPAGWGNLATAVLVMGASSLLLLHIFRRLDQWEAAAREAQARQAALQERERIAADLHDYVSQSLFYLNVQLETAAGRLAAQDTAGARRQLQEIRAVVGRLYERIRRVIADLAAPDGAGPADLPAALRRFAQQFSAASGVTVAVTTAAAAPWSGRPGADLELLGIVQEAVANAHRHGQARRIEISLESAGGRQVLTVRDDGRGFLPEAAPGVRDGRFGLALMRARAQRLGGRLSVESRPGQGTVVRFEREPGGEGAGTPGLPAEARAGQQEAWV